MAGKRALYMTGGAALILVIVIASMTLFWLSRATVSADALAEEIVAHCSAEKDTGRCYEKTVPALYPEHSMNDIFNVIREIRRDDPSYQFCHVLAHKLGEIIVAEDPTAWLSAIPLNPVDGMCSNGFIHGVIVGRFRNDVLTKEELKNTIPDFQKACEPRADWAATPLDQAICYHGMGHLFMFITNADYHRALEACDAIGESPTGNFLKVCREGVFMQTYQPLEPDDFALIELLPQKPSAQNYRAICASFANDADEGACLREAWPLFRSSLMDGTGAAAFCSGQPNKEEQSYCYDSVFSIVGRQSLGNPEKAAAACLAVPSAEEAKCFSIVAASVLEEDRLDGKKAIDFCHRAGGATTDQCLATLAKRAHFIFGSSQYLEPFCRQLPVELQNQCQ